MTDNHWTPSLRTHTVHTCKCALCSFVLKCDTVCEGYSRAHFVSLESVLHHWGNSVHLWNLIIFLSLLLKQLKKRKRQQGKCHYKIPKRRDRWDSEALPLTSSILSPGACDGATVLALDRRRGHTTWHGGKTVPASNAVNFTKEP